MTNQRIDVKVETNDANGRMWAFFHTPKVGGSIGVKNRIYDFINKLVILGLDVDHKFFKNYKQVDDIKVMVDGVMFYNVVLRNSVTEQQVVLLMPVGAFMPNAKDDDLLSMADTLLDYIEMFFQ